MHASLARSCLHHLLPFSPETRPRSTTSCLSLSGDGSVGKGAPPVGNADATLTLTVGTLLGLMNGEVSTFKAYMSGELQVEGDLQVANQLADLVGKMGS